MAHLSEQQIIGMAPNASAVSNARKISSKGGFVNLWRSEDETFYMGECSGSGKTNYITSVDFINQEEPICRCICPSRQYPCKHGLALLMEICAEKTFAICEIPEDILQKRVKKEEREQKKEEKKKQPAKVNKAARTKKIKKQLEGLVMTEQVITQLLQVGLGTISGNSIKTYKDLAKQLGDYYLPGPQFYIKKLILEIEELQKDSDEKHYQKAISILIKLHALVKKANSYLNEKLQSEQIEDEDTILYEELGGIWQLEQLQRIGLKKENAKILQLSFQTYLAKAREEYIDLGYWADLDTGEIFTTYNYRPLKALKYIKQEDSVFDVLNILTLTYYPGGINRRIRWERASYVPVNSEDLKNLKEKAYQDIQTAAKAAKNEIKNTLTDNKAVLLLSFQMIGKSEEDYILKDNTGATILLKDIEGEEKTTNRLSILPDKSFLEGQVVAGAFFYEEKIKQICIQPYSIITEKQVVRLLY